MVSQHNTCLWLFSNQVQSLEWEGRGGGCSPLSARTGSRLDRSRARLTLVHCFFLAKHCGSTSTLGVEISEFNIMGIYKKNAELINPSSSMSFLSSLPGPEPSFGLDSSVSWACSDPQFTASSVKVQTPCCSPVRSRLLGVLPQGPDLSLSLRVLAEQCLPLEIVPLCLTCEGVGGTEFFSVIGSAVIPVPSHSCLGQCRGCGEILPPAHSEEDRKESFIHSSRDSNIC